jgi:signal transduction histidine kinase
MNRSSVASTGVLWRLTVTLLAAAWLIVLTQQRALRLTSVVGGGAPAVEPGVVAGLALILAGAICVALGSAGRVSLLAVITGAVWVLPWFVAPEAAGIRRVVATLVVGAAPLQLALLSSLIAQATRGRVFRRTSIKVPAALLGLAITLAAVASLTWDPFFALSCVQGCVHAPPLVDAGMLGRTVLRVSGDTLSLVLGLWLVVVSLPILAIRPSSGGHVVVAAGGILVGLASVMIAAEALPRHASPGSMLSATERDLLAILQLSVAVGATTVALGVVLLAAHAVATRRRVRDVVRNIEAAPAPGSLAAALAAALHDPTLVVGFRLEEEGTFVDPDGRPFGVAPTRDRVLTMLESGGQRVATVGHRPGLDLETLTAELGPSALVALDNERLRAARLAQLRELQASRARVVAVESAERRRIERDLHDGAQQRLLAILMDLRAARQAASRDGDLATVDALVDAEVLAQGMIEELRRIARGIYPVVLGQAGLLPALLSLADEAPVPLTVEGSLSGRLPEPVEAAAYEVVSEVLAAADHNGGSGTNVELRRNGDVARLRIGCDARLASIIVERLRDRVGAAGGSLAAETPAAGGTLLHVELPCA